MISHVVADRVSLPLMKPRRSLTRRSSVGHNGCRMDNSHNDWVHRTTFDRMAAHLITHALPPVAAASNSNFHTFVSSRNGPHSLPMVTGCTRSRSPACRRTPRSSLSRHTCGTERHLLGSAHWSALGGSARSISTASDLPPPVSRVADKRCPLSVFQHSGQRSDNPHAVGRLRSDSAGRQSAASRSGSVRQPPRGAAVLETPHRPALGDVCGPRCPPPLSPGQLWRLE
jgi:hypothetical protein